jgi:hypothetical protein
MLWPNLIRALDLEVRWQIIQAGAIRLQVFNQFCIGAAVTVKPVINGADQFFSLPI